jgi:DNA-binding NarL/FixJ family response regulator
MWMDTDTYVMRSAPTLESYLTGRQVVVLGYLAQGRDIEGIAREMGYAPSTIKKEVHLTIQQCRARNRAHAVAIAIRAGII